MRQQSACVLLVGVAALAGCNDGEAIDSSDSTNVSNLDCHDGLIEAAHDIKERYPDFHTAKSAHSLSGFDYREAHSKKELKGAGVTLVTMTGVANVRDWTGNLNDPSLLFFEKDDSADDDDWRLIGFGYHQEWDDDDATGGCSRPVADCANSDDFEPQFLIHEAGYHISGFTVARQQDIKRGRGTLDADGCTRIDEDDIQSSVFAGVGIGAKHGRAWTMHVWLSPETGHPFATAADPWDRDGGNGWEYSIPSNTFYAQGDCGCGTPLADELSTQDGAGTSIELDNSEVNSLFLHDDDSEIGLRVYQEVVDGDTVGMRITALTWFSLADDLGLRTDDVINNIVTIGATTAVVTVDSTVALDDALANIRSLLPGDLFWIQIERDGDRQFLSFWNL